MQITITIQIQNDDDTQHQHVLTTLAREAASIDTLGLTLAESKQLLQQT
ncbi:hypothetical protein [Herpetosiphon gulosus]|uniref:Uncharacterized protein n=1 Tax=Herpetosiphon gulosus TaxID=1973496 RepID=A0ABP9X831_9CHLR